MWVVLVTDMWVRLLVAIVFLLANSATVVAGCISRTFGKVYANIL